MSWGSAIVLWLLAGDPNVAAELSRLEGQRTTLAADGQSYAIDDIAGEGAPHVGVVERRGDALWLVAGSGRAWRLTGPLAIPRIAGPGYKVWVIGDADDRSGKLAARRLGVLRGAHGVNASTTSIAPKP